MSVYKPFTTSDVIVTPFKVHKDYNFLGPVPSMGNNNPMENAGINRFVGKNIPFVSGSNTTGRLSGSYQNESSIYNSIKQLYYSNYLRGVNGSPILTASFNVDGTISGEGVSAESALTGGAASQPMYYNYLNNTLNANRYFPTASGTGAGGDPSTIGIMSIPSGLFGEYINPGSYSVTQPTSQIGTITDDGHGAIISSSNGSNIKVGDIIYEHGMIIITGDSGSAISAAARQRFGNFNDNMTCSFQSTMTIYESQYKCTFSPNEFNYSQNPSIISGSNGQLYDFATGSYFQPYITTVGLYNNANQLVAVGKLSQPLQSSNVTDTTILVNLDL